MRRFGLQTLGRGFSHVVIKKGINTDIQKANDHRGAPALLEAILRAKWRLARAEKRGTSRKIRRIKNSGMNPTMGRKTVRWVEPVLWGPGPQGSVPLLAEVICLGFQAMATAGRSEQKAGSSLARGESDKAQSGAITGPWQARHSTGRRGVHIGVY